MSSISIFLKCVFGVYLGGSLFWIIGYFCLLTILDKTSSIIIIASISTILGVILAHAEIRENNEKVTARELANKNREEAIAKKELELEEKILETEKKIQLLYKEFVDHIEKEKNQNFPYLAQQVADFEYINDLKVSERLLTRKRPARSTAEEVKKIATEKRDLKRQCKEFEYQLRFLENMFPWISGYKKESPAKAAAYVASADSNYDFAREYLSPEEYA